MSYPGGVNGPAWQAEMEVNFGIRDTARVWPDWEEKCMDIVVPDFDYRQFSHCPIYAGYDYGPQEPHAFTPIMFTSKDECYQIDEIYVKGMSVFDIAQLIKSKPYYEQIRNIYADPSIWARTQQNGASGTTSVADIFDLEYDITMSKGQNFVGVDAAFIHLLNSVLWQKNSIKFRIFQSCTNTLKELRTLAWSEKVTAQKNSTILETIASKNVHAFDALKYVMLAHWQGVSTAPLGPMVGSVDWEIERMMREAEGVRYVLNGAR